MSAPTTPTVNAEKSLRAGKILSPPRTLGLRAIAKTCPTCGTLNTTPDDRLKLSAPPPSNCATCQARRSRKFRANHAEDERTKEFYAAQQAKAFKRLNDETRQSAANARKEWTGAELEIVDRRDLSATEVALLLGRSRAAVKMQRNLLNNDRRPLKP